MGLVVGEEGLEHGNDIVQRRLRHDRVTGVANVSAIKVAKQVDQFVNLLRAGIPVVFDIRLPMMISAFLSLKAVMNDCISSGSCWPSASIKQTTSPLVVALAYSQYIRYPRAQRPLASGTEQCAPSSSIVQHTSASHTGTSGPVHSQ